MTETVTFEMIYRNLSLETWSTQHQRLACVLKSIEGRDQELIQLSTIPDAEHQIGR